MSDSVWPHRRHPTRLPHPWDSTGKYTGVGCHFLLQCMKLKVKLLSRVQLLATPWTAAHQAPPSMGFSRQEYWSGVPSVRGSWKPRLRDTALLPVCWMCQLKSCFPVKISWVEGSKEKGGKREKGEWAGGRRKWLFKNLHHIFLKLSNQKYQWKVSFRLLFICCVFTIKWLVFSIF